MKKSNTAAVEDPPTKGGRGCVAPHRSGKCMLNQEISLLMLILAAQTITGMVNIQDSVLSTELVADTHSFHGRPSLNDGGQSSSSFYSSASSDKHVPFMDLSEGISSSTADSDVSDCFDDDRDEEEVAAARLASQLTTPRRANARFTHNGDLWENIFSYLPWEAAMQVRGVSRFHFRLSLPRVTVARMPQSKVPAIFIPCLEDLGSNEMDVEAELAPQHQTPWSCPHCGLFNAQRTVCANNRCQKPRPSGGQRLFLGQLRRTGTVPMVRWLVNTVFNAPAGALVSVENRRNTHTQRGKGCAWPTVSDEATVRRMLDAHHRLFFDTVSGVEGVWLVPQGQEAALQAEVSMRYNGGAHQKHMPRGTIVVETPSTAFAAPPPPSAAANAAATPAPSPSLSASGSKDKEADRAEEPVPSDAARSNAGLSYSSAAPTSRSDSSRRAAGTPLPAYAAAVDASAGYYCYDDAAAFMPYSVPGVDFVRAGVYRLNPYTALM